jgi:hypothetical protein
MNDIHTPTILPLDKKGDCVMDKQQIFAKLDAIHDELCCVCTNLDPEYGGGRIQNREEYAVSALNRVADMMMTFMFALAKDPEVF